MKVKYQVTTKVNIKMQDQFISPKTNAKHSKVTFPKAITVQWKPLRPSMTNPFNCKNKRKSFSLLCSKKLSILCGMNLTKDKKVIFPRISLMHWATKHLKAQAMNSTIDKRSSNRHARKLSREMQVILMETSPNDTWPRCWILLSSEACDWRYANPCMN